MKKCEMCNRDFNNNPFIYCDECMDIDKAIIERLKAGNLSAGDDNRLRLALDYLRQVTNEITKRPEDKKAGRFIPVFDRQAKIEAHNCMWYAFCEKCGLKV